MRNRRLLLAFVAGAAVAATAAPGRGDDPAPAGVPDLTGPRGLALGAYRGIATGNDGIFTNAASLAARRRYSLETWWLLDRFAGADALQVYSVSVVDSETASFTGGVAYTRVFSGPWIGNLVHVPLAFPVANRLFLGLTGKYQSLDGPTGDQIRALNLDASAFWSSGGLALGLAAYNLFASGHTGQQPRAFGAGISYGDDRRYHVAVDWRGDTQRRGRLTSLYAIGGEILLGDMFPLRASFLRDDTRDASFWSAGAGFVTASGLGIDLAYRQGIDDSSDRTFAAALKLTFAQ